MNTSFEFSNNVLGIIFENKMDEEDLKQIHDMLRKKIEKYTQISIYLEDRNSNGISLKAFFNDLVFEMTYKQSLYKIAVVTDAKRFKFFTGLKEKLVDAQVESFDKEERMKAMNWVMQ